MEVLKAIISESDYYRRYLSFSDEKDIISLIESLKKNSPIIDIILDIYSKDFLDFEKYNLEIDQINEIIIFFDYILYGFENDIAKDFLILKLINDNNEEYQPIFKDGSEVILSCLDFYQQMLDDSKGYNNFFNRPDYFMKNEYYYKSYHDKKLKKEIESMSQIMKNFLLIIKYGSDDLLMWYHFYYINMIENEKFEKDRIITSIFIMAMLNDRILYSKFLIDEYKDININSFPVQCNNISYLFINNFNEEILSLLIEKGFLKVSLLDSYFLKEGNKETRNNKLLLYFCENEILGYIFVDFLIQKGVNIHTENDQAAIMSAKNFHIFKLLFKNGVNIHTSYEGPLRIACEKDNYKTVDFLIKNNADIHILNDKPLCVAIDKHNFHIADLLLENDHENYIDTLSKIYKNYCKNINKNTLPIVEYIEEKFPNIFSRK